MCVCVSEESVTLSNISYQPCQLAGVYAGLLPLIFLDILLSALQWTAGTISDTHSHTRNVPVRACVCLRVCVDLQFVI